MKLAVDVEHLASQVGTPGFPGVRLDVAAPKLRGVKLIAGKRAFNFT
jgi:hypothetical protein